MGNTSAAVVFSAPVSQFKCSVGLEDKHESSIVIDSAPVCSGCIRDHIIPKFHAAVEHEFNYPVKWSQNLTLNHGDFTEFFEDYDSFAVRWREKETEYDTLTTDRVYCESCTAFISDMAGSPATDVQCRECFKWVCSRCGSEERHGAHRCRPDQQEDRAEPDNVEGCKRCPSCGISLCLEDGCNEVNCRCGLRFCYVCGTVDPAHEHWNRGNSCPRFNSPGSGNALFNEDVLENIVMDAESTSWLVKAVATSELMSPDHSYWTHNGRGGSALDFSSNVMKAHRRLLSRARLSIHLVAHSMREEGMDAWESPLMTAFRNVIPMLMINLDIYARADRVQRAYAGYNRRHANIEFFIMQHLSPQVFTLWPRVFAVFLVYLMTASAKLASLAPEVEA